MINTILYDQDVSANENFELVTREVIGTAKNTIIKSFDRLKKLGKYFPNCIFYCKDLFDLALTYDEELMYKTLGEKLDYEEESISKTSKKIVNIIENNLMNDQKKIDMICDVIVGSAPAKSIVVLRRSIIEKFSEKIKKFKSLFIEDCPLITKIEVDSLKNSVDLIDLININSSEFTIELMSSVQVSVLSGFDLQNENVLNRVAVFYEKVYEVFGTTEIETLTKFIFEIIIKSAVLNETLESIIIDNNKTEDIIDKYTEVICYTIEKGRISENTLKYIDVLGICKNLSEIVCTSLNEAGLYKAFVINACNTNINLIDFENENIIKTINAIDYNDEDDTTVSLELLYIIRKEVLRKNIKCAVKQYSRLFMSSYPAIEKYELELIDDVQDALLLVDKEQLNEENCEEYSEYFSKVQLDQDDSFAVLLYVCSVMDMKVKREMFLSLDLNHIQYYRLSYKRKKAIIDKMSDVFDFEDVSYQILFMSHTMCSHPDFENKIKVHISTKTIEEEQEEKYAEYVREAKRINSGTISNLCSLKHIYAMPQNVLNKLFSQKKYTYYVSSKAQEEGCFSFEQEHLDELESAYQTILLSKEESYKHTKQKMAKNASFITYMANKKYYVGTAPYTRKLFAFCRQTIELLQDLFENYENDFIVEYLRDSKGFNDRDDAVFFIEQIKKNEFVASDKGVYENNHHRLVDGPLKTSFTMTYKNAIRKTK